MKSHRDLDVWRKAIDFTVAIYKITGSFPKDEMYGLTSQMWRAVMSIPSNIEEGAARSSSAEYARFLSIAIGSASELDTQIEIATRLNYLPETVKSEVLGALETILRSLLSLRNAIHRRIENN
jgi:four helix bundle protein